MKSAHTVVLERNTVIQARLETEPYEAGWATEAVWFVEPLAPLTTTWRLRMQISPDGLRWCDHNSPVVELQPTGVTALPAVHFGTWIRLVLVADDADASAPVMIWLALK